MCVPACHAAISKHLSRRGFFRAAGAVTAGAAMASSIPASVLAQSASFSKVVDLTHTLVPDFPTFFGPPQLEIETIKTFEKDHYQVFRWHLVEHTGTHMDAPFHFAPEGLSADKLDPAVLVVPLVVIDIREKAAADPDSQVLPEDIDAFEQANGALPENCCVAMNSGWAQHIGTEKFRNAAADGSLHFPGFHPDAAKMLLDRNVAGIAVDTLSLDYGASTDFGVHFSWLPAGRWGLEATANLDSVPATGATLVVGSPKVEGCTGGPTRLFALVA
jgi:kynurenine formamidase